MPNTPQPSPSTENMVTSTVAILHHLMIQLFVKQVDHNDNAGKDTSRIFSNNSIFFFRITDPTTKKYGLLIYGGEDIAMSMRHFRIHYPKRAMMFTRS